MSVMVTGGAGYVGSHLVQLMVHEGRDVVVLDDLRSAVRSAVPAIVPFLQADEADVSAVHWFIRRHAVRSVVHLTENLASATAFVDCALDAGAGDLVFASSAAVYGMPTTVPIGEDHPTLPASTWGVTELAIEEMLARKACARPFRYAALRCFEIAGRDPVIPSVLEVALGRCPRFAIHGDHLSTPDGTLVRDFVHVQDVAEGYLAALDHLRYGGENSAFNVGTGRGHSVREVITVAEEVTGRVVPFFVAPPREGEPAIVVASTRRSKEVLGWRPHRSALTRMIRDTWLSYARS